MIKVVMEKKPGPTDFVLKITSETLEEKIFLSTLYDRRVVPSNYRVNADGTVTIDYTY